MAGQTIAEGVVVVSADAKDIPRDVAEQINNGQGPIEESGRRSGSSLFKGFATFAVGATATIAATVGGLALGGGFSRALSIQDAQAKLRGLGHDTQAIAGIMDSSLASVRGTAFGLAAAATTSAGLVAAGVPLGDELTRRLKTVADTATIAGRSMEDVGLIFQSVAAKGKLQGDDLLQLMSSGVPVLQFLAKHLGITAEEVSDMVSKGEIDFQTFADAMEENLGGAALKSGETARGAWANVGASLSRLGELFAGPAVAGAPALFTSISGTVDGLTASLKPIAEDFGPKIVDYMGRIGSGIASIDFGAIGRGLAPFADIAPLIGGAILPMLSAFAGQIPIIGGLLPAISGPVGWLIGGIATLLTQSPALRDALGGAFSTLAGAIQPLLRTLSPLLDVFSMLAAAVGDLLAKAVSAFVPIAARLISIVAQVVGTILPSLLPLFDLFSQVLGQVGDALSPIVDAFIPVLATLMAAVIPIVTALTDALVGVLTPLLKLIDPFLDLITTILPPLMDLLTPFIEFMLRPLVFVLQLVADALTWVAEGIASMLGPAIEGLTDGLGGAGETVGGIFDWLWNSVLNPVFTAIGAAWDWLYNTVIMPVVTGIMLYVGLWAAAFQWLWDNAIGPVVGWIATGITWLWENAVMPVVNFISDGINLLGLAFQVFWTSYVQPAINAVGAGLNWVWSSIISPVFNAIGGAVDWVGSTIRGAFEGMASFIGDAFNAVLGVVRGPINAIIGLVNGAIDGLNSLSVTIPDWVPVTGGQTWGLNLPKIPYLARGTNDAPDAFIAGEKGPELITGARGATVRPYSATQDMLQRISAGGGKAEIKVDMTVVGDDPTLAGRKAARAIEKRLGI